LWAGKVPATLLSLFGAPVYDNSIILTSGLRKSAVLCVDSKADGKTRLYGYIAIQVIPVLGGFTKNCSTEMHEILMVVWNELWRANAYRK
jgi:hypothetical protein